MSDEDDDELEGLFEDGHWEWDDNGNSLVFINNTPKIEEDFTPPTPNVIGSFSFKDDLDLFEQQRFRKRFQRRPSENDVVYLQDFKDVALFTAPRAILTSSLINILHLPVTERFIRALILYCQYFLQISDEMSKRMFELNEKVRTTQSDQIELQYRENLEDLRLLVAKEYSCMIMGGGEIAKYHHMGPVKKLRSLSKRDSILFESLLRVAIQIVWLALGRKSYNQIELEIHRLFKSEIYNIIEHKLKTKYASSLTERELFVLYGHCVRRKRIINTFSPLNNEMHCHRDIDYRLLGLGTVIYPSLGPRLRYLERALIASEDKLEEMKVTVGILGKPRGKFDTLLKEIKMAASTASSSSSVRQSMGKIASTSRASRLSTSTRKSTGHAKLYEDVNIPEKDEVQYIPDHFPTNMLPKKRCNDEQRKRWLNQAALYASRKKRSGVR